MSACWRAIAAGVLSVRGSRGRGMLAPMRGALTIVNPFITAPETVLVA
jgi:hypothetical protein